MGLKDGTSTRSTARRRVASTAAALLASVALTACSLGGSGGGGAAAPTRDDSKVEKAGSFDDASTMAAIQDRGKLVVGLPTDLPRFAFDNPTTGSLEGFDIEIARLMASGIFGAAIEGKVEFIPLDPRDRGLALSQNKVDIALGRYPVTADNKRFADFAGPYFVAYQSVLTNSRQNDRNNRIETLVDLNARAVCTVRGSTKADVLQDAVPQVDLTVEKATTAECAAELNAGRVVAIAAEHVDLISVTQNDTRLKSITREATLGRESYGIGVSRQKTDLRQYLNDRLELIVRDDRWQDAFDRTITEGSDEPPAVERY